MDEQPSETERLEELALARRRAALDAASEAEFALRGRPTKLPRQSPPPPQGLAEGVEVANQLRAEVAPAPRDFDAVCDATLLNWWTLRLERTPRPHDPACAEREPSYEAPDGRRHDRAACRRRLTQHLSPVRRSPTLGEVLAIGVLIRCDQQPDYPLLDDAVMVLEALPALDLGRLAGLGAALAACWASRRADPGAQAGTWLSRIRRCVLPRPEWARPDPTFPTYVPIPTCGRFVLDTSQAWRDPLRRRLACCEKHAVAINRHQGTRDGRVCAECGSVPMVLSSDPPSQLPRCLDHPQAGLIRLSAAREMLRNAQPLDTHPPENRQI